MASLTATGVGSGMNLASLVDSLVAADRAPHELRLNRQEAGAKAKLSALGTVTSALDQLQRAMATLKSGTAFTARTATSSAPDIFKATAAADTPTGSYEIEVLSLASAHKLVSGAFAADTPLGTGTLRVEIGSKSIDVEIDAESNTPAQIAARIQSAAKAEGLALGATAVTADDGVHLVFSAGNAGSANQIKITRTAGDASLDALVYDPGTLTSLTEKTEARDAQVRVDGLLRSAQGNTISDLVPGLSVQLLQSQAGTTHTLTVGNDATAARNTMQAFVSAYNLAVATIQNTTKYDASTKVAAALNGDAMVRGASNQLRNALGEALAGAAEMGFGAGALGLNTKTDGTLTFDAAKFDAAVATHGSDAVAAALGKDGGLAGRLDTVLGGLLGSSGTFGSRTTQLNATISDVGKQRDKLETRMLDVETRYRKQYAALDSLVAQLQQTGNYLTQQLANLG